MIALGVQYLAVAVASCVERNWPRALYYLGALIITVAVMWMTSKGYGR